MNTAGRILAGLVALLLASALAFLSAPGVSASSEPTLWEHYNTGEDSAASIYLLFWEAQTFTVGGAGHTVNSIKVKIYKDGLPGTCYIGIRATDGGGHPTGSDLTSTSFDGDIIANSPGAWYDFSVPVYTLSADTKYAIVLRAPSGGVLRQLKWWGDQTDPTYDGGNVEYSINGGSSWTTDTGCDRMFEIWVMNTPPTADVVSPENEAENVSLTPTLDWSFSDDDGDSQTKYWVMLDNDSDFSSPVENTDEVSSDNTHYAITTPLDYENTYYWKVKVYDGYEWSEWQGVWNFTTRPEWFEVEVWTNYFEFEGWNTVEVWTDYFYHTPFPDVEILLALLSVGVIVGLGLIGFNVSKGNDPVPGLFMISAGVLFTWWIGWLPLWILVTSIALIAVLGAVLWGKIFRGGGD